LFDLKVVLSTSNDFDEIREPTPKHTEYENYAALCQETPIGNINLIISTQRVINIQYVTFAPLVCVKDI